MEYVLMGLAVLTIAGALVYAAAIYRASRAADFEHLQQLESLRRARAEADAANRARSRFVERVSHEIRTPLNTMLLTLDMLEQPAASSEERRTCLAVARASGRSLKRLSDDLLELARIESGERYASIGCVEAIVLVNLGTPSAPTEEAVRRYLAEFLSDPRVVKLPRWLWLPVLHGLVLRSRPKKSAEKYAQIWTPEGSPLAVHTRRQSEALGALLPNVKVEYAMRYGEPGIAAALARVKECQVTVVPLYPQYSDSASGSVADVLPPGMRMVRDFHDHPRYIAALASNVRTHWKANGRGSMLVMSFHGLPQRGSELYERQCRATGKLLAGALGLKDDEWRVTFQSRFGYARWLEPYTEATLVGLAQKGNERVDVVCPGFVSDCLETLEEIGIAARRRFLDAGGRQFYLVSCLNEAPEWVAALADIARGSG